ncbi:MAG TPA: PLP-dependent lyase/thiolase, partial [Candidatus Paceibacterota bacterium]|nr:PLP-dependent lyase/thiolase [Candidatus Paceibacterota bacterium]
MITPQKEAPEIARELGIGRLFLKREDLHPYGSHKGRSIPLMIDMKVAEGARDFVISSSGNAALAALRHIQKKNAETGLINDEIKSRKKSKEPAPDPSGGLTLTILVGSNMNKAKRAALEAELVDPRIKIEEVPRPLQALFNLIHAGKESLRQSTDDEALLGYKTLAHEIASTPDLSAVFIGTSSGTTAQALADYFAEHGIGAAVHIVQTRGVSPIARNFAAEEYEPETSLADAIVDKVAHRGDKLSEALKKSG